MRIFEFKDKEDKTVYLTNERWSHITIEHPEITNYLKEFNGILKQPTKVINYLHDNKIKYYYKYFKDRKENSKYLLIIVKYLNGEGFIITSYFMRTIK